jgi:hypothetical protein
MNVIANEHEYKRFKHTSLNRLGDYFLLGGKLVT